jgi:hypothetical protein
MPRICFHGISLPSTVRTDSVKKTERKVPRRPCHVRHRGVDPSGAPDLSRLRCRNPSNPAKRAIPVMTRPTSRINLPPVWTGDSRGYVFIA